MIIGRKPFEIRISLFVFPVLAAFILTGYGFEYAAAFASISLHELGHILLASRLGIRIRHVELMPSGLFIALDETFCSRRDILITCTGGPIVNLALALSSMLLNGILPHPADCLWYLTLSNLYLAVFNMIPAIPLDGGRILQEILSDRIGLLKTGRLLRRLGAVLSAVFLLLGVYQLLNSRINFTLFIIGFYMMLLLISGRMEAALMNMKQIVLRRSRLLKKGTYQARELVTLKTTLLGSILKEMDYDCFHYVRILDEGLKTIGILSEADIMESILKYNGEISFGKLLELNSGNEGQINI